MHSLFPFAEIQDKLGPNVELQQFDLGDYDEILRLNHESITGLALNVWNRIVHGEKHNVDPMALRDYIQMRPSGLKIVNGIEEAIGETVIQEISYSRCTLAGDNEPVAKLLVARVYPNDLHWADVHFRNPHKPIPPAKRRFEYQKYEGFGLLPTVASRIDQYAEAQNVDYITLTAAAEDLVPLFTELGFSLETNQMGRMARAMEKRPGK